MIGAHSICPRSSRSHSVGEAVRRRPVDGGYRDEGVHDRVSHRAPHDVTRHNSVSITGFSLKSPLITRRRPAGPTPEMSALTAVRSR